MKINIKLLSFVFAITLFFIAAETQALSLAPFNPYSYVIESVKETENLKINTIRDGRKELRLNGQPLYEFDEKGGFSFVFLSTERDPSVPVYEIELSIDNPNLKVCYWPSLSTVNRRENICGNKIKFDSTASSFSVEHAQSFGNPYEPDSQTNQKNTKEVFDFEVVGRIGNEPLSMSGKLVYDNSEAKRSVYNRSVSKALFMYQIGPLIYRVGPIVGLVIIGFIVYKILRFVIRKIRSRN